MPLKTPLLHQSFGSRVFLSFFLSIYTYFWLIPWSAKAGCKTQGILTSFLLSLSHRRLQTTRFQSNKGPTNYILGFTGGSVIKNPPDKAGDTGIRGSILGSWIPWRRKWQPTPVFLPGYSRLFCTSGMRWMMSHSQHAFLLVNRFYGQGPDYIFHLAFTPSYQCAWQHTQLCLKLCL